MKISQGPSIQLPPEVLQHNHNIPADDSSINRDDGSVSSSQHHNNGNTNPTPKIANHEESNDDSCSIDNPSSDYSDSDDSDNNNIAQPNDQSILPPAKIGTTIVDLSQPSE